jgi:hypothetical protein
MTVPPKLYAFLQKYFRLGAESPKRKVNVYVRATGQAAPTIDDLFELVLHLNAAPRIGPLKMELLPPMITGRQYKRLPIGLKKLFVPKEIEV